MLSIPLTTLFFKNFFCFVTGHMLTICFSVWPLGETSVHVLCQHFRRCVGAPLLSQKAVLTCHKFNFLQTCNATHSEAQSLFIIFF